MKRLLICLPIAVLAACATSDPDFFRAAEEQGEYGYFDVALGPDRYRVSFTGDAGTSEEAVKDLALLRAAEVTMQEGYDWFRVVTEETEQTVRTSTAPAVGPAGREVRRDCGLLGCTTTVTEEYSGTQVVTQREADRYSTTFEIVLGDGEVVDPSTVYDATSLRQYLHDRYDVM